MIPEFSKPRRGALDFFSGMETDLAHFSSAGDFWLLFIDEK
jgi:hypothetical protein